MIDACFWDVCLLITIVYIIYINKWMECNYCVIVLGMQALLKRAGSMLRPATPYIFQIQTMNSLRQETKVVVEGIYTHTHTLCIANDRIQTEPNIFCVNLKIYNPKPYN